MPPRRTHTDANQAEIVAALEAAGATVQDLHEVGGGCPDVCVGFRGVNYFLEIKQPGHYPRDSQVSWILAWQGRATVVFSAEEALREIGAM